MNTSFIMHFNAFTFLLLSLLAAGSATLYGKIDVNRLQRIFEENVNSQDPASLYFKLKGMQLLKQKIPDLCSELKFPDYDLNNMEQMFYIINAASIAGCLQKLNPEVMAASTRVLEKKDVTIVELYYAVYSLKAMGKGSVMEKDDALKNLVQLLKKDDSPANYAYVFMLCEHIGCQSWTASHAEELLQAADEVDGRTLHFEGGLPVTSMMLGSIIRSYQFLKKPSPLSADHREKFAEYLLSRRSVNTARGAYYLLDAALALCNDQPTPVSIVIKGQKYITSESDSVEITVSDLLGRPVPGLKPADVIAQSGTRLADDVVVLSKQPLTQKSDDPTTFALNLSKIKTQYGVYKIAISAGSKAASVNVAVLGDIQVANIEVGVGDVDGTTSPKITNVAYPNRLTEELQADHLQKVSLKFTVRDKQNKPMLVQQAFVRVSAAGGGDVGPEDEAIFVAEPDNTKAYKVELLVGSLSKHLNSGSGQYELTVYLGDSAVSNPIAWNVGQVALSFARPAKVESRAMPSARGPKPAIAHLFREPEPRPPRALSDLFAGACAAPLLLLVALWAKLRVNFSHFPFTPSALIFHLALGASLGLYGVLWLKLTMFETVRCMLPLAALTFLSGHRLLRRLVRDKAHK